MWFIAWIGFVPYFRHIDDYHECNADNTPLYSVRVVAVLSHSCLVPLFLLLKIQHFNSGFYFSWNVNAKIEYIIYFYCFVIFLDILMPQMFVRLFKFVYLYVGGFFFSQLYSLVWSQTLYLCTTVRVFKYLYYHHVRLLFVCFYKFLIEGFDKRIQLNDKNFMLNTICMTWIIY